MACHIPRRLIVLVFALIAMTFCYWVLQTPTLNGGYYGKKFDIPAQLQEQEQKQRQQQQSSATMAAESDENSVLDDYSISRFLLPDPDRQRNAVESGNLSYDRIRSRLGNTSGPDGKFNADGTDVLVFLHVQKTGGTTFERYLVRQLKVPRPCQCRPGRKRCLCRRPGDGFWLFSRFSTGWQCGLHADYTELVASGCVDNALNRLEKRKPNDSSASRRYFLTTFLREPTARYYSEYRHVTQRGATWGASLHFCKGRSPTAEELPSCFDDKVGWVGASLKQFLNCSSNLANNRQARMLADLTLVNCYSKTGMSAEMRDSTILRSAKVNLKRMAFFGLQEEMRMSQYVFERTFGLDFSKPLLNWNETSDLSVLSPADVAEIRRVNYLDLQLYEYARSLFFQRFEELKREDALYDLNIAT